jgi:iron-sulfur cluster assembly protein
MGNAVGKMSAENYAREIEKAMAIELTERAAKEVVTIINDQKLDPEKTFLRLGVKGGGCSGFSYTLDLTENRQESDESWDINGVKVICDPKSQIYLDGTSVDFKDEVMGRGFVFNNPNATNTCGCGSSFSA